LPTVIEGMGIEPFRKSNGSDEPVSLEDFRSLN
jgi:hypothetical protein